MDYKYIEQLLERYWQCETNLEEETILRSFFNQPEIPAHLQPYKEWFAYKQTAKEVRLNDDFDAKILALINEEPVKAHRITLTRRLMPLYKAAASIAILLTLGTAAQNSFRHSEERNGDYNYSNYEDTYNDPEAAYNQVSEGLEQIAACLNETQRSDTTDRKIVLEK